MFQALISSPGIYILCGCMHSEVFKAVNFVNVTLNFKFISLLFTETNQTTAYFFHLMSIREDK